MSRWTSAASGTPAGQVVELAASLWPHAKLTAEAAMGVLRGLKVGDQDVPKFLDAMRRWHADNLDERAPQWKGDRSIATEYARGRSSEPVHQGHADVRALLRRGIRNGTDPGWAAELIGADDAAMESGGLYRELDAWAQVAGAVATHCYYRLPKPWPEDRASTAFYVRIRAVRFIDLALRDLTTHGVHTERQRAEWESMVSAEYEAAAFGRDEPLPADPAAPVAAAMAANEPEPEPEPAKPARVEKKPPAQSAPVDEDVPW